MIFYCNKQREKRKEVPASVKIACGIHIHIEHQAENRSLYEEGQATAWAHYTTWIYTKKFVLFQLICHCSRQKQDFGCLSYMSDMCKFTVL